MRAQCPEPEVRAHHRSPEGCANFRIGTLARRAPALVATWAARAGGANARVARFGNGLFTISREWGGPISPQQGSRKR